MKFLSSGQWKNFKNKQHASFSAESSVGVEGSKSGDEDIKQHRIKGTDAGHIKTQSNRQELLREIYANTDEKVILIYD